MKNVIVIFLIFIIISCKNSSNNFTVDKKTIKIDSWINDPNFVEKSLIKNINYIFLETSDDCLIGSIDKILYSNDKIFIFDKSISKALFVFSLKGKFLFKIQNIGRGPGEFVEPYDFDIDRNINEKVHIYDNFTQKIITYQIPELKFEENKVKFRFENFSFIDKNQFLFHSVLNPKKNRTLLGVYNLKKNQENEILAARNLKDDFEIIRYSTHSLYNSNQVMYFHPRFSNYVLKIYPDLTMSKKVLINNELIPDEEYISKLKEDRNIAHQNEKYINGIINIYESDKFLFMTVVQNVYKNILISKSSGNRKCFMMFDNKRFFGYQTLYGLVEDQFISIIDPSNFETPDWLDKIRKSDLDETSKNTLMQRKSTENHVIGLIDFYDF